jgi:hypothetical protein
MIQNILGTEGTEGTANSGLPMCVRARDACEREYDGVSLLVLWVAIILCLVCPYSIYTTNTL